ncbi:hypothetical protein C8R44DRAFT_882703 [Mycena epipterygia]|nr:hypothetical protein C8R44DRAFT_882703 [Mycena epipterygia]
MHKEGQKIPNNAEGYLFVCRIDDFEIVLEYDVGGNAVHLAGEQHSVCPREVALVGTLDSGLTWSGRIFVNPVIARVKSVKLITLTGTAIMILGLFSLAAVVYDALFSAHGAFIQAAGTAMLYYMASYSVPVLSYFRSGGSVLLVINSGVNSVSRIALGLLTDRVGKQNTSICLPLVAVGLRALVRHRGTPPANISSRSASCTAFTLAGIIAYPHDDHGDIWVENYPPVNGFIYFVRGLGSLLGAPITGLILRSHEREGGAPIELAGQLRARSEHVVYDGLLFFGAGMCVAYVRWIR